MRQVLAILVTTLFVTACGGSNSSPTSPTPSPAPAPAPAPTPSPTTSGSVTINSPAATSERTASGVIYHITLTLREMGGRSAANLTSITVRFFLNGVSDGSATYTTLSQPRVAAGGSQDYRLDVTDNSGSVDNAFSVAVNYTDDAGAAFTVSMTANGAISAPSPAPSPSPSPSGKYDGTYDFFFKNPGPGGVTESHNLSRFLIIRNGAVSSSDGTVAGTVDSFGAVRFTAACPINNSVGDWTGNMNASALAGSNFGQGQYTCRIAIGGGANNTWQANQSR